MLKIEAIIIEFERDLARGPKNMIYCQGASTNSMPLYNF